MTLIPSLGNASCLVMELLLCFQRSVQMVLLPSKILLKALNGYSVPVSDAGVSWARLGSDLVCPAVFVFNWSRQTHQLPPDSLVIMEPHDDHKRWKVFFFFFLVTLGIKCHIKWVVAALRGLWPRGMFRLMEIMFSLVGLLGFPLVSSSFGLFDLKLLHFPFSFFSPF